MDLIHEVAMLAPLAVIAAMNLSLYLSGERGTLLAPVPMSFPGPTPGPVSVPHAVAEAEFRQELRLAA